MRITEDYFEKQADILHGKYKSSSIKGHKPDTGTNREEILKEYVELHLPKTVTPYLGGKIIDSIDNASRQTDIIIYNNSYPRFGALPKSYYFSEGVVAAIEVKSLLTSGELDNALVKIDSVKKCQLEYVRTALSTPPKHIFTGIFAFEMKYKSSKGLIAAINKKVFTGKYEQGSKKRKSIYVGDLVTLGIPRKKYFPDMIVFKVIKDGDGFSIVYRSGAMSEGDPNYRQSLNQQVYKVIGNSKEGIKENLLIH